MVYATAGLDWDTVLIFEIDVGSNYDDTMIGNSGNHGLTGGLGTSTDFVIFDKA